MEPIDGESLREAREQTGKTQQELADAVGVSLRTVGNWERGGVVPRKHWPKVLRALPNLASGESRLRSERAAAEAEFHGEAIAGLEVLDLSVIHEDDLIALWASHEFQANRAAREFARRRGVVHADAMYPLHLLSRGEARKAEEVLAKSRAAKDARDDEGELRPGVNGPGANL